jgi:hypothetical protein
MTGPRWLWLVSALAGATAPAIFAPALFARQTLPTTRTIYASVMDKDDQPVLDVASSEIEVREGGRVQAISVRPATAPLRVALIVSDAGRGQFQVGALRFCEALVGHGEIAIAGVVVDFETLTDYTQSVDALRGALLRLGRRGLAGVQDGVRLIETILRVAKGIPREGYRPAIVVMRAGGEALPAFGADSARAALRASGAVVYVVSALADSGFFDFRSLTVDVVLNDGSRESGGRHVEIQGNSMVPEMQRIASELINQYEITYTLPSGVAPSDRISVSSTRKGVTVRAPSRIAR